MKKAFLFIVLTLVLSGCASIVGSTTETVSISSNVENAKITVYDKNQIPVYGAIAPTSVRLKKKVGYFSGQTYSVIAEKEGYKKEVRILDTTVSGWYWGNLLFGGIIGLFLVDPLTGSMWTFDDDKVYFLLQKEEE